MSTSVIKRVSAYTGQLIFFGLFIVVLMVFSNSPPYKHFSDDKALIKISISHSGQIKGECHKRTAEELARLSPNMRVDMDCPRERSVIQLELDLDGKPIFADAMQPTGIKRDGSTSAYYTLTVPSGKYKLAARLKDHINLKEFNYVKQMDVVLAPAQVFTIDFEAQEGGFIFR